MNTKLKQSELDSLEVYRLALTNVDSHPEIAQHMSQIGYSAEILDEGRKLYEGALDAYSRSVRGRRKQSSAHKAYSKKWNALKKKFIVHRNKANIIFRKDELSTEKLGLSSSLPDRYIILIAVIKNFYSEIAADDVLKQAISRLNVPEDEINAGLNLVKEVEALRADYIKEKAEAQNATERKRAVFQETYEWMHDFFSVAKIAFGKDRQLLEAFGKVVKS